MAVLGRYWTMCGCSTSSLQTGVELNSKQSTASQPEDGFAADVPKQLHGDVAVVHGGLAEDNTSRRGWKMYGG